MTVVGFPIFKNQNDYDNKQLTVSARPAVDEKTLRALVVLGEQWVRGVGSPPLCSKKINRQNNQHQSVDGEDMHSVVMTCDRHPTGIETGRQLHQEAQSPT